LLVLLLPANGTKIDLILELGLLADLGKRFLLFIVSTAFCCCFLALNSALSLLFEIAIRISHTARLPD
jgi:hypothetical protein